jgi:hypothetical protein
LFNRKDEFSWLKRAFSGSAWTTMGGKVRPQASDDDAEREISLSVMGLFGSVTLYILYAIYKDLQLEWPTIKEAKRERKNRAQVEPHADEGGQGGSPSQGMTMENITFTDATPGHLVDYTGADDPLRNAPLNLDATLDNFFSRPLKIYDTEWAVGTSLFFRIDPWTLYFENQKVLDRLQNYKLMTADLHIKIMLNGNAFHYGRCIACYNPLNLDDDLTVDRNFIDVDVVAGSQRPHIWLNPTTSEGGEMKLPFFFYNNVLDIVAREWRRMGVIDCHSLQLLKHANGATDNVTVSVFAWAENVKFSVPTDYIPGEVSPSLIEPQADEYGKKPVSRIAGAIAKIAGRLSDMPVIGLYARATEIGATAIGAMATLFGYASPVMTEMNVYVPLAKTNLALTNVPSDAQKLTMDVKQELSVDPRTVGLPPDDQMTLKHITSRESYLCEFDWNLGTNPEILLWQAVVDPSIHRQLGREKHMPALAFASMPFTYWRGTMKFRFMVVCSNYHKGRLKIVYDPEGGKAVAPYNTAYTTIVDISEETDFTIDVGWGQSTTWRKHRGLDGNSLQNGGPNPLGYTSSTVTYGNGTISVYVVNELTVPNTTVDNDIQINVFVSACDDFELCVPDDQYLRQLHVVDQPSGLLVEPQGMDIKENTVPENPPTISTMASKTTLDDPSSLFHFGEAIGSFRSLLKRYQLYTVIPGRGGSNAGARGAWKLSMPLYPVQSGYVLNPTKPPINGPPRRPNLTGDYMCVTTTLLRYLSSAYGGMRGGVRYAVDTTELCTEAQGAKVTIGRRSVRIPPGTTEFLNPTSAPSTVYEPENSVLNFDSYWLDGKTFATAGVNPVLSAEVPFYSRFRFEPGKQYPLNFDYNVSQPGRIEFSDGLDITISAKWDDTNQWVPIYVSVAEDFSLFWYLGPPRMYVYPAPVTSVPPRVRETAEI